MFLRAKYIIMSISIINMLTVHSASYASPPIPPKKTQTIESYNERLEEEKKQQEQLKTKANKLDKKINSIKHDMVSVAEKIQNNEKEIKSLENRIIKLEIKKSVLEDNLRADRASISRLILALEKIRRTPPEAMIARPETPYKIAQSAMLMGGILPSIDRHAEKLSKNLETLNTVQAELEEEKEAAGNVKGNLDQQHKTLKELIAEHKKLYAETNKNLKISEINIKKISMQAKNLNDLVDRLKKEEQAERERQKQLIAKKAALKKIPPSNGQSRFPISGIIRTSYDQKDDTGSKSNGLTFEGRPGGIVTAPMNGKISFTGTFKRYGNIVIIEHDDGYHSLLAGIEDISANIGDIVKIGEPIGLLPKSSLIPHPTLYYELRKNGKPTNPAAKFSDLG